MNENPRFITKFVSNISSRIEPELLGVSTLTWWQNVHLQFGNFENTKLFYKLFRKCLYTDLSTSHRLKATGIDSILLDMIKYCFSGEPFLPPSCALAALDILAVPTHSICKIKAKGKYCL